MYQAGSKCINLAGVPTSHRQLRYSTGHHTGEPLGRDRWQKAAPRARKLCEPDKSVSSRLKASRCVCRHIKFRKILSVLDILSIRVCKFSSILLQSFTFRRSATSATIFKWPISYINQIMKIELLNFVDFRHPSRAGVACFTSSQYKLVERWWASD